MSNGVNPKPVNTIRLFKSDFLEWFTHVHPAVPAIFWGPIFVFFLWRSLNALPLVNIFLLALAGLLVWTLLEYTLHRFFFHLDAKNRFLKRLVYLFHGAHHDIPNEATRLVMPPVVSISLGIIVFAITQLVFPKDVGECLFTFIIAGYLAYDYIHYYTHHARTKSRLGRFIKKHHMKHHAVDHDMRYGVSSPLWDWVFRTYPASPKKSA